MNQEIEDCFVSNYLNKFDVLILIALKRIGLHYLQRYKIIRHYRKINNERKLENDIQTFMFQYSDYNSYTINIRRIFYRPQRLPFQQGINNLVQIHRKYGHEIFNKMYIKYFNNLLKKYNFDGNIIDQDVTSSTALYFIFYLENIENEGKKLNEKKIGSFFHVNSFRIVENRIISQISRSGDIITNIDVPDPNRIIKSVRLFFNDKTNEQLKFTFDEKESLFNFDIVFPSVALQYIYMNLVVELKDNVIIADSIIEKLKANILYHQIPNFDRKKLYDNKYYMEITDCYGDHFFTKDGSIHFNIN